jgi:cellulose biosynthesis protein BcsQ
MAVCRLFKLQAKRSGARFVFVDCGPSASLFNQTVVTSCDYILPPASPDFFSVQSVSALMNEVLPRWKSAQRLLHERWEDEGRFFKEWLRHWERWQFNSETKLLPVMINLYDRTEHWNPRRTDVYEEHPSEQHSEWIMSIARLVREAAAEAERKQDPAATDAKDAKMQVDGQQKRVVASAD